MTIVTTPIESEYYELYDEIPSNFPTIPLTSLIIHQSAPSLLKQSDNVIQDDSKHQVWKIKYIFKILLEFKPNQTNHTDERFLYSPEEDIMKQIYGTRFLMTISHGFGVVPNKVVKLAVFQCIIILSWDS